jgi:hypothetical protein
MVAVGHARRAHDSAGAARNRSVATYCALALPMDLRCRVRYAAQARARYERRTHFPRSPSVFLLGVCSQVPRQVALDARAVAAVLADKRLLPSVQPQVPRQAALDARAVAAVLADKRLLPSVQPQVLRQGTLVARAVAAVLADKRLLPSVQPQVPRQGTLVARAVAAVLADKRLLPSVQPQVRRQAALDACTKVAVLADKRLLPSVQPQVRRQAALVARAVAAVLADKRLLPSVQPQVRRQAALVARAVAAVLALVGHHRSTWGLRSAVVFLLAFFSREWTHPAASTRSAVLAQASLGCKLQKGMSVRAREAGPRRARLLIDDGQWR